MRQKRKLIQKRKLQTTNLTNDWKVTMNINKQKVLNFVLTLEAGGRKIPQNILRSTWKTIWKIKQHLNYILMIINQNILPILWTFLNLKKKKNETLHQVHFHIDCPITFTSTLTLHETKIRQMNPCQ